MQIKDWIQEWLILWPAQVKSGGESIRSKPEYCVKKLQKLQEKYPAYTKETIFAATLKYLKEREADNWFGVRRAMYFIDKQNVGSILAEYCAQILDPQPVTVQNSNTYEAINDYI